MRLCTTSFNRGSVLDLVQEGNRISVAGRNSSSLAYDVTINGGEEPSSVKGCNEVGEPVDYLISVGASGVTVTDELHPGTTLSDTSPRNYSLRSKEAQQNLAVNVISALIGVPLAFDPSQLN